MLGFIYLLLWNTYVYLWLIVGIMGIGWYGDTWCELWCDSWDAFYSAGVLGVFLGLDKEIF